MKTVAIFDFDGTITKKDTFLQFIKFAKGKVAFVLGFLLFSPWLIAMKFHLYPNWKTKQMIFSYYFKGMHLDSFNEICLRFFEEEVDSLLYKDAINCIDTHLRKNDEVVIISASIDNWVRPFAAHLGIKQVLGTQLEIDTSNERLTGYFSTKNCYGKEKVYRLLSAYQDIHQYKLVAYGDSRGDKEMLEYANESHYKPFNK